MSETKELPVICKFWQEDGVWNGEAVDLPIAVFGKTFEEALDSLKEGIVSHFNASVQVGSIQELINTVEQIAVDKGLLSIDDIMPGSPLVKMLVAFENHQEVVVV